jgi:excisionase family DNA binding protein
MSGTLTTPAAELRTGEHRQPIDRLPALLSVTRAAEILGLSRASAYRYAAAGELPTKRLGGRVYIVTAELRPLLGLAAGAA